MVKAVFRINNSVVPISNFREECWMAMFTWIENILVHTNTNTTLANAAEA